jgi:hypothetical protein
VKPPEVMADELIVMTTEPTSEVVERTLQRAREHLEMDVLFVSEFTRDAEIFRVIDGDGGSFGLAEDTGIPREQSYCQRVLDGRLPAVIPDAHNDPLAKALPVTDGSQIGAYIGAPLVFSDGRVYGMLCCLSHEPNLDLGSRDAKFMFILARMIADQLEREELEAKTRRLEVEAIGVQALMRALEARDGYTGDHSKAVVDLSMEVAKRLDAEDDPLVTIEPVALLHDIGKIGIPDSILLKPGPLDDDEWTVMRQHPVIGANIVGSITSLTHFAPAVRAEHERWDGGGYPDGLSGSSIPLASRVVLACDAFHAMVSERPYRKPMPTKDALIQLERGAGTQFCPLVIEALLDALPALATAGMGTEGDEPDRLTIGEISGGRLSAKV